MFNRTKDATADAIKNKSPVPKNIPVKVILSILDEKVQNLQMVKKRHKKRSICPHVSLSPLNENKLLFVKISK